MLFSLFKYNMEFHITDTALKVSRSLYCFTTSISHGVENYFSRLWGTGISGAILIPFLLVDVDYFVMIHSLLLELCQLTYQLNLQVKVIGNLGYFCI